MNLTESINSCLDALPRPRLAVLGRDVPTFRTCGIAGFYLGLIVLMGAGLLTGRSLIVLAVLALVSGLSFFTYAHLRKWITGYEELVLLEQVWFALACNAGALWLMSVPLLPYLDVVSIALCPFLAAGRAGCTLVGCCHGNPSSLGITYNEACARDGFARHLVGVRLFPAAAIEGVGLIMIGLTGLVALPFAAPGKVFAWCLLAYAIMRFGLEGIRADRRPHFLGLSQARWMSIIEVGVAIALVRPGQRFTGSLLLYPLIFGLLVLILAIRWQMDWRRRLLSPQHCREVCELAHAEIKSEGFASLTPERRCTSLGLSVALSRIEFEGGLSHGAHISISLPEGRSDLLLLCELAASAFPKLSIDHVQFTSRRVLHLIVPTPLVGIGTSTDKRSKLALQLYGNVVRHAQRANERQPAHRNGDHVAHQPHVQQPIVSAFSPDGGAPILARTSTRASSWYFNGGNNRS